MKHVLFSAWPDHQTPESAGPLLRLVAEVEDSLEPAASTRPIMVHCRYEQPHAARGQAPAPAGLSQEGSEQSRASRPRADMDRSLQVSQHPVTPLQAAPGPVGCNQAPPGAGWTSGAPHVLGQGRHGLC